MIRAVEKVRDAVLFIVAAHEAQGCERAAAGEPCRDYRANVVGFLAHSLGFDPVTLRELPAKYVEEYARIHRELHGRLDKI